MKQNIISDTSHLLLHLKESLLHLPFVRYSSVNFEIVDRLISHPNFAQNLKILLSHNSYSCQSILQLSSELLYHFAEDTIPDNWIYYIYQYVLNKSYPNALEIKLNDKLDASCIIYLTILKEIRKYFDDKNIFIDGNDVYYPICFLSDAELKELSNPEEYESFVRYFEDEYVYEMMLLNQELTGHNTLSHISGVHYIAMHIGRQLYANGLPIDLGRVSGAAAGHDLGKYGCVGEEVKRVPYLHYYYTDLWFTERNIPMIGHIATNHSVWDLELENLPIESLILIYADFRVKNIQTEDNQLQMKIFSLDESFDIILSKLDNVDDSKEKRYRRVYNKLSDFEKFMVNQGIQTCLDLSKQSTCLKKHYNLMFGDEIVQNIKFISIHHNINLMYKLRSEASLSSLLELARTEDDWKKLRSYIQVLEEYSTHLTQRQKLITINFLYELLVHPEEDLRKQCADLIGVLIAGFDEKYRKELPANAKVVEFETSSFMLLDKYMQLFIHPDHKYIDTHREWIGYSFRNMIHSLFSNANQENREKYIEHLSNFYGNCNELDAMKCIYLLEALKYIPYETDYPFTVFFDFINACLNSPFLQVQLSALERTYYTLIKTHNNSYFVHMVIDYLNHSIAYNELPSINYLHSKIAAYLSKDYNPSNQFKLFHEKDLNEKVQDIFLRNLKTATNWIDKKINIEILERRVALDSKQYALHTAMHYCNLLKVSAFENVRNHAGTSLLNIADFLTLDQRNDVCVELIRALEMENYHFTKYIPYYLGRMLLFLHPQELDEIIEDFEEKIRKANRQINFLILKTIGNCIQYYSLYPSNFKESDSVYQCRLKKLLGILITGIANYDIQVRQEAFRIVGTYIFGSHVLNLNEKNHIFSIIAKRILILSGKYENDELLFLNNSASLNHIYRFISDYSFFHGQIELSSVDKIAFFPGTFDPFTLSHKNIATSIRDLGFEVYLAVDEFSWSKKTQAHMLRRELIAMSMADEFGVQLLPDEVQVNIANPESLKQLSDLFPDKEVYMVVGSDVVLNASSYKLQAQPYSIHQFSHIVFIRKEDNGPSEEELLHSEAFKQISGEIIPLQLPSAYEDISSSQIRNYIDQNRDISSLIDPLAQKFIYDTGIYRREPQYKSLLQTKLFDAVIYDIINDDLLIKLNQIFFESNAESLEALKKIKNFLNPRILIVYDISNKNEILGFSLFHWTRSSMLFSEFKNNIISEYIRENSVGRIVVIDGIFVNPNIYLESLNQILLTETLTFCLARDYTYGIFHDSISKKPSKQLLEILELQGFMSISPEKEILESPVLVVNMSNPCTLTLDLDAMLKEPFRSNVNVQQIIQKTRKRLQKTLTHLYPGHLLLSFDRDMLYQTLVKKICQANETQIIQTTPRVLGPNVCAPFGSILKGFIVPNTITKSLHTEKMFNATLSDFTIEPYPFYMSIEHQIAMIKAFNRPVILVDDILNKGYRIKVLDPILRDKDVDVHQIIVGILSGRGKELMDIQERTVDAAYFLPNLRVWFNENAFYPFIGGETIWRGDSLKINLLPSINFILPYATPHFIRGIGQKEIFSTSKVSIENAIAILEVLEEEYLILTERNLTLKHLGEVFVSPRYPDRGGQVQHDLNLKPSTYLKNDFEHLLRMKNLI